MAEGPLRSDRGAARRGPLVTILVPALLVAATVAFALGQGGYGGEDDQAAAPPDASGVSTGVFTTEQAERGAAVFQTNCSGCHGAELQGGFGPQLAPIDEAWHGLTLGALYRFVSTNMPFSAPGSLEPQQYADVVSFVLSENGYPAGEAELAPDAEALEQFVLDDPPTQ